MSSSRLRMLETFAVKGLVLGHLVNGVVNGVEVLLQIADARYLYSLCGLYLVKRHRRPYRGLYLVGYPDAEILQLLADDVLVFAYLVFRDTDAHAVVFQDNP